MLSIFLRCFCLKRGQNRGTPPENLIDACRHWPQRFRQAARILWSRAENMRIDQPKFGQMSLEIYHPKNVPHFFCDIIQKTNSLRNDEFEQPVGMVELTKSQGVRLDGSQGVERSQPGTLNGWKWWFPTTIYKYFPSKGLESSNWNNQFVRRMFKGHQVIYIYIIIEGSLEV